MTGTDRAAREEAAALANGGRRDWIWAIGLLVVLGGASWIFDRALDLF
jgi:hypothetical protein